MTVKELIEKLKDIAPEQFVYFRLVDYCDCCYDSSELININTVAIDQDGDAILSDR